MKVNGKEIRCQEKNEDGTFKKRYIIPALKEREFSVSHLIAASLYSTDKPADESEVLSNNRRGQWGDLWGEGEE